MGYANAYRNFGQTLQQAMALSGSINERKADCATADGTILFARMVIQAHNLMSILPPADGPAKCLDLLSCAAITRNLVETFVVLYDRWLEEVSPSVRRFRDLFWCYHQRVEGVRVLSLLKGTLEQEPFDKVTYTTRDAKHALENDPEFCRLDNQRRTHLLNKREPCARGQQAIAVAAGIKAAKFDSDYKLLSSLSHPNGFCVRAMDATTWADDEWQVWFAQIVWIAQNYLDLAVSGVKKRLKQTDGLKMRAGEDTADK